MSAASAISPRRYRRRILALGALAFVVVFAVGAAIFVPIVQNDLEDRVEAELVGNGIVGVTASFSGQDGTLVCATPLDDPARVERIAEAPRGVRVIDLDRTCVDGGASGPDGSTSSSSGSAAPGSTARTGGAADDSATSGSTAGSPVGSDPAPDTITDVIAGDPLFSQLSTLVGVAGLSDVEGFGSDGPITVFAPTNAAFDAAFDELGADAFGALTSDPDLLRPLLLHHATTGRITAADLVDGPLQMLDGGTIDVDANAVTFTSGTTVAGVADPGTQLDIEASDGVVHAIDRLLIPTDLDLGRAPDVSSTTARLADGVLTLDGVVADDGQRDRLLVAARSGSDPANVVDRLVVDAAAPPLADDVDRLAVVVEAMVPNLVSGDATLADGDVSLVGITRDASADSALRVLGVASDVRLDLGARPVADPASAQQLADELNGFVGANPILFESNSIAVPPTANAVIEQIAARIDGLDGISVVVVGHTDSDGSANTNLLLSQGRAAEVVAALVADGVAPDIVSSEGRGSSEPVLAADGGEDQVASRRVEFVVEVR